MENISSIIKQNLELRKENIGLREENIKLKKEIKTLENKLSNAYRKIKRLVMGNPITIRELTEMKKKKTSSSLLTYNNFDSLHHFEKKSVNSNWFLLTFIL